MVIKPIKTEKELNDILISFYEPPDEVIRENGATANHDRNCDFQFIIHFYRIN